MAATTITGDISGGTGLTDGQMPTGSVLQVVQVIKSDTFTTTSTSYVDVTGVTASITPVAASSRILCTIVANIGQTTTSGHSVSVRALRGSSAIGSGASASNRQIGFGHYAENGANYDLRPVVLNHLDHPNNSTNAAVYKLQMRAENAGTGVLNRTGNDADNAYQTRTSSSITLTEIAG